MRPQQNRRMRGRGNNNNNSNNHNHNRKGPNPLTRSYESNGPDVKIRGTAQQIAEKYTTLARDAQSSGDRVIAENYLQHAEHYNRIIMTAQAQQQAQNPRDSRDDDDQDDRDEGGNESPRNDERQDRNERTQRPERAERPERAPAPVADGNGPQPVIEGTPAEVGFSAPSEEAQPAPRRRGRPPRQKDVAQEAAEAPAEDAGQDAVAQDGGEENAPRKPRRTRRPRKEAGVEDAPSGAQPSEGSKESVPEAAQ